MHARLSSWPGHLPRAGGLEDQDELLMQALRVLATEDAYVKAAHTRGRNG